MRPIHIACSKGYTDIVEMLLSRNCNIETETEVNIMIYLNKTITKDIDKMEADTLCL